MISRPPLLVSVQSMRSLKRIALSFLPLFNLYNSPSFKINLGPNNLVEAVRSILCTLHIVNQHELEGRRMRDEPLLRRRIRDSQKAQSASPHSRALE